jgi:putative ABC transport system ATP-binding protein
VLLADEPTGNLDSTRAAEVLALLRRFNRERGQTVVLVTYDPEVGAACDRIVRMRDGLVVHGDKEQPDGREGASSSLPRQSC